MHERVGRRARTPPTTSRADRASPRQARRRARRRCHRPPARPSVPRACATMIRACAQETGCSTAASSARPRRVSSESISMPESSTGGRASREALRARRPRPTTPATKRTSEPESQGHALDRSTGGARAQVGAKRAMVPGVKVDALVLLGCRVKGLAELSAPARRRTERTVAAYREVRPRFVIARAGATLEWRVRSGRARYTLVALGVDEGAIVRERASLTTRENAHYSARLLRERGVSGVGSSPAIGTSNERSRCFRRGRRRGNGDPAASLPDLGIRAAGAIPARAARDADRGPVTAAITRAWRSS